MAGDMEAEMKIRSTILYNHLLVVIMMLILAYMVYLPDFLVLSIIMIGLCIYEIIFELSPALRVLEMDKDGCKVRWLFWKKRHKWIDLEIICQDYLVPDRSKKVKMEGVFFSVKSLDKISEEKMPLTILRSRDYLNCFYILFDNAKEKKRILDQLNEWGVKISIGKTLAEQIRYERMVEARSKIREERKKISIKSKKH